MIGVSTRTVQYWEKGKTNITLEKAKTISKLLDVPLTEFFNPDNEIERVADLVSDIKKEDVKSYITNKVFEVLESIPLDQLCAYIVYKDDKLMEKETYKKFLEGKIKDGVILELTKRLQNRS